MTGGGFIKQHQRRRDAKYRVSTQAHRSSKMLQQAQYQLFLFHMKSIRPLVHAALAFLLLSAGCTTLKKAPQAALPKQAEVVALITKVNDHWQATHPPQVWAFWDAAAYQTGNMAAYAVTKNETLPPVRRGLGRAQPVEGCHLRRSGRLEIQVRRNA